MPFAAYTKTFTQPKWIPLAYAQPWSPWMWHWSSFYIQIVQQARMLPFPKNLPSPPSSYQPNFVSKKQLSEIIKNYARSTFLLILSTKTDAAFATFANSEHQWMNVEFKWRIVHGPMPQQKHKDDNTKRSTPSLWQDNLHPRQLPRWRRLLTSAPKLVRAPKDDPFFGPKCNQSSAIIRCDVKSSESFPHQRRRVGF